MLNFDEKTGFSVSETSDLLTEVGQEWINAFKETGRPDLNTDPETPQGQIITSQVAAIHQKDTELAYLANQFNPLTASGKWQDALGKIYFLTRKPAIASSAICTLTGLNGTVVEAGAQIRSSYDQTLWTLAETVTINTIADNTYTATGTFTCNEPGAVSAGVGTLNQIVTTTPGWDTVTNSNSAVVGQDEESQAAFEARRFQSVALNARGTVAAVYARVAQVDNVIAVYAIDNKTNVNKVVDGYTLSPHSIYVAVLGGLDSDVANAIYNSVSAGCDYNGNTSVQVTDQNTSAVETVTFMRPDDLNVYIKVTVNDDGNLPDGYETLIQNALIANFYGEDDTLINNQPMLRIVMNSDVYASRFIPSITNAGIAQVLNVQLSVDGGSTYSDFIHIPITDSPVLSADTITVDVQGGA